MKVRLSPTARAYVKSEAAYLGARNPAAARRFLEDLRRLQGNLGAFPHLGQVSDEMPVPGVFRFVMGDYLLDYDILGEIIRILAIRHGRERPPGLAMDDDFDFES